MTYVRKFVAKNFLKLSNLVTLLCRMLSGSKCFKLWTLGTVWPDWAIYWALGNHSKPVATITIYPNHPHCWAIFVKVSKSFIFLVKSFLGNFFRHLVIFICPHWLGKVHSSLSKQSSKLFQYLRWLEEKKCLFFCSRYEIGSRMTSCEAIRPSRAGSTKLFCHY